MASGGPVRELCEEVTCPICLEYFKDPATIAECGHNFCRACLTRSWGESGAEASCPVCKGTARLRNLRPNRQLANIVEITRKLTLQGGEENKEEIKERICEKHRKPLELFCQTDEILICGACKRTKKHKKHEVIPAEEASREYKDKIFSCLETLRTKREKIADESQDMLKIIASRKEKAVAEFRTLHQWLIEQENDLLAQIEEIEKAVASKRDQHLARISEELSSLESLIREMEEKQQQPGSELLQDVRGTLQRYEEKETFTNPEAFPYWLKSRVHNFQFTTFLEGAVKEFKDTLAWEFPKRAATVTLDPASASYSLRLFHGQKCVRQHGIFQELFNGPEKNYGYVLGTEGFTASCKCWGIMVDTGDGWAVGVARKPVKETVTFTPEEGIWAVGRWKGQYKAFIKGTDPPLTLRGEPTLIRVCLNYDGGRVTFFDAERAVLLYEFSGASFSGETLHPFFAVYGNSELWLFP